MASMLDNAYLIWHRMLWLARKNIKNKSMLCVALTYIVISNLLSLVARFQFMKKFLILGLLIGLTACKKEAPKCSDEKATDLAIDIFHSQVMKELEERFFPLGQRPYYSKDEVEKEFVKLGRGIYAQVLALDKSKTDYRIENIRTIDFNKQTGAYKCKGTMVTCNKADG